MQNCYLHEDISTNYDMKLSFINHMEKLVTEARKLYYSFVQSEIVYASLVWYPIYCCNITELERLQIRFLRHLYRKINGVYPHIYFEYT